MVKDKTVQQMILGQTDNCLGKKIALYFYLQRHISVHRLYISRLSGRMHMNF